MKIVYYYFGNTFKRIAYINAWRRRNEKASRQAVFIQADPWKRDSRARMLGLVFLHDGDERALKEYEWYKKLGLPEENAKELWAEDEIARTKGEVGKKEADSIEDAPIAIEPILTRRGAKRKGKK